MALWLGDDHLEFRREHAVANGWFARAERLLDGAGPCAERGWLTVFSAHAALNEQDTTTARRLATDARELGKRLGVVDLEMFALATEGLALVAEGAVDDGMRRLDEASAAALAGEFAEFAPAGWTCCFLIAACERVRDFDRAAQWCKKVEEFTRRHRVRFVSGACRAHYAAVLAWHGRWAEAERELSSAADDLSATRPFWRSEAVVRLGDLRRRQGRHDEAQALFDEVESHPLAQLGLAELALDRGEPDAARDRLERTLRRLPPDVPLNRTATLELLARAAAATGDPVAAATYAAELRTAASIAATRPLRAAASLAEGVAARAAGATEAACARLEDAVELYRQSAAPLETARAQLELAEALATRGNRRAAIYEATAARRCFDELGAVADSGRARSMLTRLGTGATVLTDRQLEVLRLVAQGLGDREVAARLTLSEHTVHRHMANVYARLECSSRAAAVARASHLGLL
jgi:LuxR family maltose regulon positive regulatory protein